jgi:hypothetical protein
VGNFPQEYLKGLPTRESVLRSFQRAVEAATSEDQVVLSIFDHGENGWVYGSCVSMHMFGSICMADVKKILKQSSVKGRVFVLIDSCHAGAFTSLSSRDVCTFVGSGKYMPGFGSRFWEKTYKSNASSLEELRRGFHFKWVWSEGGGFASHLISEKICAATEHEELSGGGELRENLYLMARKLARVSRDLGRERQANRVPLKILHKYSQIVAKKREELIEIEKRLPSLCTPQRTNIPLCIHIKNYFINSLPFFEGLAKLPGQLLWFEEREEALDVAQSDLANIIYAFEEKGGDEDLVLQFSYPNPLFSEHLLKAMEAYRSGAIGSGKYYEEAKREKVVLKKLKEDFALHVLDFTAGLVENLSNSVIRRDILNIAEAMCGPKAKTKSRIQSYFTLSALNGDGIPSSKKSKEEALLCESEFSF